MTTPELCEVCGLTYEGGFHEVREDGRFPTGGHYFEDGAEDDEFLLGSCGCTDYHMADCPLMTG